FDRFYMFELPISGLVQINYGSERIASRDNVGSVISTARRMRSLWSADARRFMVQVDRGVLERFMVSLLDHPLDQPIEFKVDMDTSAGAGSTLAEYVRYIFKELDEHDC